MCRTFIVRFFHAHSATEAARVSVVFDCRFQPFCRESSRPTGDALLLPPADDCLFPDVDAPETVGRCEPFPGSDYPSSLPERATVRLAH